MRIVHIIITDDPSDVADTIDDLERLQIHSSYISTDQIIEQLLDELKKGT